MQLSRREMLGSCIATGAAMAAQGSFAETPARKLNIVVILADDIGHECYGAYGSTLYQTPNFDTLAREGALFTHAYSQPLCTPSRVQLMTGKYNFRNYTKFGELNLSEPTFAKMLKTAGYKTCIAGKWQLTPGNLQGPHTAGFDEYLLWHFLEEKSEKESEFSDRGSRYKSPKLYKNGEKVEGTEEKYGPDLCDEFIANFIDQNHDKPFLVYYPMMLVHAPYDPVPGSPDWESGGKDKKNFPDMVNYMDKSIGRLVATLDKHNLRETTLIIVTGDNGTGREIESPLPSHGTVKGGKGAMTDAGTHVAFAMNWPGHIKPGTVVNAPIEFSYVLPTIAEVAGQPVPDFADGQSLIPLATGHEDKARGWIFMSYARDPASPADYRHFARDERWKLYADGSLYDLSKDIDELTPVTGAESGDTRKCLQAILDRVLKS